ncbi:MAG TPA: family 43 glycosylhydrolase [Sphingomicrobium sp.]|nr:family 43 glycosylhydrolase [Sphingomicrobium sp.]
MADAGVSDALPFDVEAAPHGDGFQISVAGGGVSRSYDVAAPTQQDFSDFFRQLAADFGTRIPHVFSGTDDPSPPDHRWRPLLTENVHRQILCGYGDPSVLKADDGWWLVATSNDAPDAFPILHSADLDHWQAKGFIFPEGQTPDWAASGRGNADFWAPEMARVGDGYWAVFTARQTNDVLAIGLARAAEPSGPWTDNGAPLITGAPISTADLGYGVDHPQISCGVIEPHLFLDANGDKYLFWKDDSNGIWPRPLAMLLRQRPRLIGEIFGDEVDRRTAAFAAAIVRWANLQRPMVRFFLMQPLIEAALANWDRAKRALAECGFADAILGAMTTPIRGQRIADDGHSLLGESSIVLANDLDWEGHLIEGPFVTRQHGRYWLFYAGNDFSTPAYGIGVAVADHPLGPYTKQSEPLLRSTGEWLAPGHASVAPGRDGKANLFFHAFHPGPGGYNAFRALLTVGLRFTPETVEVAALPD